MKNYIAKTAAWILIVCILCTCAGCGSKDSDISSSKPDMSSTDSSGNGQHNNSSDTDVSEPDDSSAPDDFNIDLGDPDDFGNDDFFSDFDLTLTSEQTVKFDNLTPLKTNYIGLAGVNAPYWFMPDSTLEDSYNEAELNMEVSRLLQMGVSAIRAFYAPGWSWDAKTNKWDWESDYMKGFYKYCDILKKNNIDVILNPYESLSGSQIGETSPFPYLGNNDPEKYYDLFGEWAVDFYEEVIIKRGYSNIKYFMYATEPNNGDNSFERFQRYARAFRAVDTALKKAGYRDKLFFVGPQVTYNSLYPSDESAIQWLEWAVKYLDDVLDAYSAHAYVFNRSMTDNYEYVWKDFDEKCKKIIDPTGKQFWHDEYNVTEMGNYRETSADPLQATQLAFGQITMMNTGADASIVWQLADMKWPNTTRTQPPSWEEGIHVIGLNVSSLQSTIPRNAYYVYCMMGTAIKAGDTIYKGVSLGDSAYGIMMKHKNGKHSIIAINLAWNPCELTFDFTSSLKGADFERLVYDPSSFKATTEGKPIAPTGKITGVNSSFKDTIGSYQVVVYNQY